MMELKGIDFRAIFDFDHGAGYCTFLWEDRLYGKEGLTITIDGHCSRQMSVRSGNGPPDFELISKDRILIRFDASLAKKLELDELIEIQYAFTDSDICELKELAAGWSS